VEKWKDLLQRHGIGPVGRFVVDRDSRWKAGSSGRMGHISLWPGFMYLRDDNILNNIDETMN
jgi:hypothetical protein